MPSTIVDRRGGSSSDQYVSSRERFLRRNKEAIDRAIDNYISGRSINDIGTDGPIDITVPKRDLKEPNITHGQGGKRTNVHPGNKEFMGGDQLQRPQGGQGQGTGEGEAGEEGQGEDDFVFQLTQEELLERIFERLGLPNLEERNSDTAKEFDYSHAGYQRNGTPSRINFRRSKRQQIGRHLAASAPYKKEIISSLQDQLRILNLDPDANVDTLFEDQRYEKLTLNEKIALLTETRDAVREENLSLLDDAQKSLLTQLDDQIAENETKIKGIPRWDEDSDLRYRFDKQVPRPSYKAVMICMMDISGSMSEQMKHDSKLFYWLLNKLLKREYGEDAVEMRYVVHTTEGWEVDEQEFYETRENGGTKVSAGLDIVKEIKERDYGDGSYNVYIAQTSDGDNWRDDNPRTKGLIEDMLPDLKGFFYMETKNNAWGNHDRSDIWNMYQTIRGANEDKFFMGRAMQTSDITRIFVDFFNIENHKKPAASAMNSATAAFAPKAG
ncbi:MAG: YeaH/YhbH family protein [Alphaproteobacteria bacterium]|nr:YeaH/YhbH family protein [Alphaproteobacteria bacterium]